MRTTLLLLCFTLPACFHAPALIPYDAQPLRIENPQREIQSLILANTVAGCVTEPSFTGTMLVVKAVCSYGVGNQVARLDRVTHIGLEQSGEWYGCRVTHGEGSEDFLWTSRSREDMQRMVDAFTALVQQPAPAAPAKSTSL